MSGESPLDDALALSETVASESLVRFEISERRPMLPRNPYCAVIGRPSASVVLTERMVPPAAWTSADASPSPPSESGMRRHSAFGSPAITPLRIASATVCADAASLNESGASRYLMAGCSFCLTSTGCSFCANAVPSMVLPMRYRPVSPTGWMFGRVGA